MKNKNFLFCISLWCLILAITSAAALANKFSAEIFIALYAIANSAGAGVFLFYNEKLASGNFEMGAAQIPFHRDIAILFLTAFGPFGLLFLFYALTAAPDEKKSKFDEYLNYLESSSKTMEEKKQVDIKSELRKQYIKEPVIDSIKSMDKYKKRGAIEILYKLRTPDAVLALKSITKDENFEIRFFAINKLAALENEFLNEIDWYKTCLKVAGPSPELLFHYAALILKFAKIGLLFPEFSMLYFKKSARIFKAIMDAGNSNREVISGLARALRYQGETEKAYYLLKENFEALGETGIDEYAHCVFKLKKFDELKSLSANVREKKLPTSAFMKQMAENTEIDETIFNDIYPAESIDEIIELFGKSDTLDYDSIFLKITDAVSVSKLSEAFPAVNKLGKSAQIIFLKLLKGRNEPEIIPIIDYFIKNGDPLLGLLASDALTSADLSVRKGIFLEMLNHKTIEIQLIAINFIGMQKIKEAATTLGRAIKSGSTPDIIKTTCAGALCSIKGEEAAEALSYALENFNAAMKISVIASIKNEFYREMSDKIFETLEKETAATVKKESLAALVSLNEPRMTERLAEYFLSETDTAFRTEAFEYMIKQRSAQTVEILKKVSESAPICEMVQNEELLKNLHNLIGIKK